jgi:hypothetical protein
VATLVAAGLLALPAHAVPIMYPDQVGATVAYVGITEDSTTDPTPLFGAPTLSGDALDFNPVSFGSTSTGLGGVDTTDGTLSMGINALSGNLIEEIQFRERGDFRLIGTGGAGTFAAVTMKVFVDVIEIDGKEVNIDLGPGGTNDAWNMVFMPSDGDWDLSNDGPGPLVDGDWSGALDIDVTQALIDLGYGGFATKVKINLDNALITLSEEGTTSFIKKKDVDGLTITVVPEPSTLLLMATGCLFLARGCFRRRDRMVGAGAGHEGVPRVDP